MNYLTVGTKLDPAWFAAHAPSPCLFITDPITANAFLKQVRGRIFDYEHHSFNPLRDIDYLGACNFVETLRYLFPAGETTLTREEADYLILRTLLENTTQLPTLQAKLDPDSKEPGERKAHRLIGRILLSPVLKRVLTGTQQFDFSGNVVVALDPAKLGPFDVLALAWLAIGQHKGQVLISDFVRYGRPFHTSLIDQERLTCRVSRLTALAPDLRQAVLSIADKAGHGCTYKDALELANAAGLAPDFSREDNEHNRYIRDAMKA